MSGVPVVPPTSVDPVGPVDEAPDHDVRAVLAIAPFRRLWAVLAASSFGDWLGLLATTTLAAWLAGLQEGASTEAGLAVAAVLALRLAPALLLGPVAGVVADRVDRRVVLVAGDVLRGLLFLSIVAVGELWWLLVATVLIEMVGIFWLPAKDAMVPTLVPRHRLEAANQIGVVATYGTAPVAAVVFAGIGAAVTAAQGEAGRLLAVDIALVVNAVTFLVAGAVVATLPSPARREVTAGQSVWADVVEGWRFIVGTPLIRGLVGGMVGAFAAAGTVMGLGILYADALGAGQAGYGVLFGAAFLGMALGVWQAPRSLRGVDRRRLFGTAIVVAGLFLLLAGFSPHIALSALAAAGLGLGAGTAWVTGLTLLGGEVDDAVRGRTFAFVQTAIRVVLLAVLAAAPALAALIGDREAGRFSYSGPGLVLAGAGVLAVVVGVLTRAAMDRAGPRSPRGRPGPAGPPRRRGAAGPAVRRPARAAVRRPAGPAPRARRVRSMSPPLAGTPARPVDRGPDGTGFFVAIEGGDGAGKSTQVQLLVDWLIEEIGHEAVMTREPGGTNLGRGVRALLLTYADGNPEPRAEALLFAADRAQHVDTLVRPALARGAVVVTDRYVDSSLAYQGARGELEVADVAALSRWATGGLRPDLTVVLDLDPGTAAARLADRRAVTGAGRDRIETESSEFHAAVRDTFLRLAAADPDGYVVVDADRPSIEVADDVQRAVRPRLPLSRHQRAVLATRLAADADAREAREAAVVAEAQIWLNQLDARL
ncbi:MAG: dTMP kinase [Actinomycetales bacterium]